MSEQPTPPARRRPRRFLLSLSLLALAGACLLVARGRPPRSTSSPQAAGGERPARDTEASDEVVLETCGRCHLYPPPEIFPKALWAREVERGLRFFREARPMAKAPSFASLVAFYEARAPEVLPLLGQSDRAPPFRVRWQLAAYGDSKSAEAPAIANVRFLHLSDRCKLDVVACDMLNGKVLLLKPYTTRPVLQVICDEIPNPCHAEAADMNGDGVNDLLIANLGSPIPSESPFGTVVWLRGQADGSFSPLTLADGLGRVADVQPADFDGDGDLDLVVAAFGRLTIGEILILENRTVDYDKPVFVRKTIDHRHGAIHVPVADLNNDDRPDFVALISQEHETVVAFLNAGDGQFRPQTIYAAPHPAFGSSGIQIVDLDRDGDLDILMSNGDSLDSQLLRPYHGLQWLENQGSYPFRDHRLTSLYGVHRAVAGDLDGDEDLDIAAACFLPGSYYKSLSLEMGLDAIVILEQTAAGQFTRRSIETGTCLHATCDLGDFDADGKVDLVTGNFFVPERDGTSEKRADADSVIVRRNLGPDR